MSMIQRRQKRDIENPLNSTGTPPGSNPMARCARPWASLMLYPNESGPECQLSNTFMKNTTHKSVYEVWNSSEFIELRKRILDNEYPELCNGCPEKNRGLEFYSQFKYLHFSSKSGENFKKNRDEYIKGATRLESKPIAISVDLQYLCNFQCTMCDLRFRREKLCLKQQQEVFSTYSCTSVHMHFSGGEPLLHKGFLRYLHSESEKPTSISITTNGSLLNREILESLLAFPYVNLFVSIDSFNPEKFAKLRPGPVGLSDILDNVKSAIEYKEKINAQASEPRWHISLQIIPILDNIEEFPSYLDRAHSLGIDEIVSCPISGDFPQQDFTRYPQILDGIDVPALLSAIKLRMKKYPDLEVSQINNYLSALTSFGPTI